MTDDMPEVNNAGARRGFYYSEALRRHVSIPDNEPEATEPEATDRQCARCRRPIPARQLARKLRYTMQENPLLEGGKPRMRTMFEALYCAECGELAYEVLLGEGFIPGTATQEAIASALRTKAEPRMPYRMGPP